LNLSPLVKLTGGDKINILLEENCISYTQEHRCCLGSFSAWTNSGVLLYLQLFALYVESATDPNVSVLLTNLY